MSINQDHQPQTSIEGLAAVIKANTHTHTHTHTSPLVHVYLNELVGSLYQFHLRETLALTNRSLSLAPYVSHDRLNCMSRQQLIGRSTRKILLSVSSRVRVNDSQIETHNIIGGIQGLDL